MDISKATFDAAPLSAKGTYKHKQFTNDSEGFAALLVWLAALDDSSSLVGREAIGA